MRFQPCRMKIAGGVRENVKNHRPKTPSSAVTCDLGPVTSGLIWYVDLAYAYLPCKYEHPILIIIKRVTSYVKPLTLNI